MTRYDDLCVSRPAIAGRHLWINQLFFRSGAHFISDALGAAIRERRLKGFQLSKMREA